MAALQNTNSWKVIFGGSTEDFIKKVPLNSLSSVLSIVIYLTSILLNFYYPSEITYWAKTETWAIGAALFTVLAALVFITKHKNTSQVNEQKNFIRFVSISSVLTIGIFYLIAFSNLAWVTGFKQAVSDTASLLNGLWLVTLGTAHLTRVLDVVGKPKTRVGLFLAAYIAYIPLLYLLSSPSLLVWLRSSFYTFIWIISVFPLRSKS